MISSHSTVLFPLSMAKPNRPTIVRTCWRIKSIDMNQFQSDIESSLLLSSPAENMDNLAEQYQETLSGILENHAPNKVSIPVRQRDLNPWYSSDIAEAKLDCRRLERRWRRSKLEVDRQLFVEARNNVSRPLLDAKTSFYPALNYYSELSGNQSICRVFFGKIEKIRHKLQCCIGQPSPTSSTQSCSVRSICRSYLVARQCFK